MAHESLGKYEIRGHLGRGSFAEVLLAWHPVLEAPRALKVPFDQSPQMTERLAAEARIQAQLAHPHICHVYDTDEAEGTFFIVMEYAAGGSLRRELRESPLPLDKAVAWVIEAAEALSFAHERGIVHRDLKPDNLLLSAEGKVKVADFGLARILQPSEEARTRAGTVQYMAPEHLKGQATFLSDLWSLGVVFYEVLTGRLPFRAESHWALASRIMSAEPAPIEEGGADLPQPIGACVQRLLERDPARRTPSAEALLEELHDVQRLLERDPALAASLRPSAEAPEGPSPSLEATVTVRDWPLGRGGPGRTGSARPGLVLPLQLAWRADVGAPMVASPVVSHGVVVVVTTGGEIVLVDETWGREVTRHKVGGSLSSAPSLLDEVAYVGGYEGRLAAFGLSERAVAWKADLGAPVGATPAASEGTLFVPLLDGRLLRVRREDGSVTGDFETRGPLASPPLLVEDLVVFGSRENLLYAVGIEDMSERWRFEAGEWIDAGPSASEGLVVVGSYDGSVTALEVASGRVRWQADFPSWVVASTALGSQEAYVLAFDGTLAALDLEDGSVRWRTASKGRYLGGPALAGELLVVAGAEGLVTARGAFDGLELWSAPIEGECLGGPVVAGRSLYVAGRDGVLYAFR